MLSRNAESCQFCPTSHFACRRRRAGEFAAGGDRRHRIRLSMSDPARCARAVRLCLQVVRRLTFTRVAGHIRVVGERRRSLSGEDERFHRCQRERRRGINGAHPSAVPPAAIKPRPCAARMLLGIAAPANSPERHRRGTASAINAIRNASRNGFHHARAGSGIVCPISECPAIQWPSPRRRSFQRHWAMRTVRSDSADVLSRRVSVRCGMPSFRERTPLPGCSHSAGAETEPGGRPARTSRARSSGLFIDLPVPSARPAR